MKENKKNNTLTITEMSNITGVRRQTLQQFESMSLLLPINEDEIRKIREENQASCQNDKLKRSSTWKYRKEDANIVNIIELFHLLGYSYKKIKDIISNGEVDTELKNAYNQIDDRIRELQDKKNYIKYIFEIESVIGGFSEDLKKYFWKNSLKYIYPNYTFVPISQGIKMLSKSDIDVERNEKDFIQIGIVFILLLTMNDAPHESKCIEECINILVNFYISEVLLDIYELDDDTDEISRRYAAILLFSLSINHIIENKEHEEENDRMLEIYGEESFEFVSGLLKEYLNDMKKLYPEKIHDFDFWDENI